MNTLHREITNQIVTDFYDQPIMSNLARPHYVERMIALGLGDEWRLEPIHFIPVHSLLR